MEVNVHIHALAKQPVATTVMYIYRVWYVSTNMSENGWLELFPERPCSYVRMYMVVQSQCRH